MTERLTDEAPEKTGTISTDRFEAVRYRYGHDCGDTFGEGSDYDGLALTVECADAADAQAMLDAISSSPAPADDLRAAARKSVVDWIKKDACLAIQMTISPEMASKLIERIVAALSQPEQPGVEALDQNDLDEAWKSGFNAGFGEAVLTRPTVTVEAAAVDALAAYQQADMDGIMVLVSRQAIEECLPALRALAAKGGQKD